MSLLQQFIGSRLDLVKFSLDESQGALNKSNADRRAVARYSVQQAFFYQADHYLDQQPLVSVNAWNYVQERYGFHADKFWSMKRSGVPRLEKSLPREARAGYSKLPIIYEHIYTGTMFWNALRRIHRSGRLDVASIEEILSVNFRTAWIHREEDDRLPQSYRGVSLLDAYSQYKSAGIRLLKGPDSPFEYHALTGVDSRIPDSSEVRDAVVSLDESFSEFMASPIEGAVRVIQAGGIEDSERLKRHRESKTTAFFPENWRGIARCESSFRKGGHWSTGLPIVFWFEKGKGDGDLHLRAEIGPWHDVDQRSRLVERLRDCDWSSTRGGGGATYCRFWWRRVAPSVPDLEGMRDAWAELSEFLPDIDAALQDFGFIA